MRDTQSGDLVLHVNDATIQGFSIVAASCREVTEEPPSPGQWAGMAPYYRVDLRDYRDFPKPVTIADFIRNNTAALAEEIAADHPHRFPFQLEQSGLVKTVQGAYICRATPHLFDLIRASVHIPVGGLEDGPPPFTVDDALQDVFLERSEFEEMIEALQRRRNIILQGPPGVGKSFLAKRLAYALMAHKDPSRVKMVQFHQSYAYEDFVQGWRPAQSGGFRLKNGLFYEFCRTARDGRTRVFIIDEINRGNLSKILGELMLLIEHDKRGAVFALPLTYSEDPFYVPENVYIVGLMNTADRSLALVDYALRRRFVFFDLRPRFDNDRFQQLLRDRGVDDALLQRIVDRMSELNGKIAEDARNLGAGFCIGHSFFCPTESDVPDEDWYKAIVRNEIAPLVREYWFDSPDKAKALIERLAEL
jgi:MoxR-like ATPase